LKIAVYVIAAVAVLFLGSFMYLSMNSRRVRVTGLVSGKLRPCPGTPNCIVSEYRDEKSHTEPFAFSGEASAAWKGAKESIISLGGRVEKDTGDYLWATFRSRIWRFVDDVELRLDTGGKAIYVRSASRVRCIHVTTPPLDGVVGPATVAHDDFSSGLGLCGKDCQAKLRRIEKLAVRTSNRQSWHGHVIV